MHFLAVGHVLFHQRQLQPADVYLAAADLAGQPVGQADELGHKRGRRARVDLSGRCELLQPASVLVTDEEVTRCTSSPAAADAASVGQCQQQHEGEQQRGERGGEDHPGVRRAPADSVQLRLQDVVALQPLHCGRLAAVGAGVSPTEVTAAIAPPCAGALRIRS